MDKTTHKALLGSIHKWERIIEGTGVNEGASNCPLCRVFLSMPQAVCKGCPVYEHTGMPACRGTPYPRFEYYQHSNKSPTVDTELKAAAVDELRFLRSLLP